MTDGHCLGSFNGLGVIRANQMDGLEEMAIAVDQVDTVFGHEGSHLPPEGWRKELSVGRNVKQVNILHSERFALL